MDLDDLCFGATVFGALASVTLVSGASCAGKANWGGLICKVAWYRPPGFSLAIMATVSVLGEPLAM